jgi:hypothetical protein
MRELRNAYIILVGEVEVKRTELIWLRIGTSGP